MHTVRLCEPHTHILQPSRPLHCLPRSSFYAPRVSWASSNMPRGLDWSGQVMGTHPAKPLDAAGALVFKPQLVGAASGPVYPPQHHVEQLPLWHDIGEATHWWCSQS